jgi:hypothetical protein
LGLFSANQLLGFDQSDLDQISAPHNPILVADLTS